MNPCDLLVIVKIVALRYFNKKKKKERKKKQSLFIIEFKEGLKFVKAHFFWDTQYIIYIAFKIMNLPNIKSW